MSKWNEIDLDSSFNKTSQNQEDDGFSVQDDKGNDLGLDKSEIVTDDKPEDEVVLEGDEGGKKKTRTSSKEDTNADDDSAAGAEDKATAATGDEEQKKYKSRAQERIRQLVKEKKESEAKWQSRFETLEKQFSSLNTEALTSQQEMIEARIKDTKRSLVKAQEEGKFDESTELMSTLSDLQTKKIVVDSHAERAKEEKATKKAAPAQTEEDFDDTELLGWIGRNKEWWQKDPVKTTLAIRLSKRVDKEGVLTPGDAEYYEEIDERLKKLLGEDSAQEDNQEDLQSSSKEVAKTKKMPQTSSGASRTSAVTKSGGKLVVRLEPEERAWARKLGMTDLDWAKQKVRQSKNKDEHGYQNIFDN